MSFSSRFGPATVGSVSGNSGRGHHIAMGGPGGEQSRVGQRADIEAGREHHQRPAPRLIRQPHHRGQRPERTDGGRRRRSGGFDPRTAAWFHSRGRAAGGTGDDVGVAAVPVVRAGVERVEGVDGVDGGAIQGLRAGGLAVVAGGPLAPARAARPSQPATENRGSIPPPHPGRHPTHLASHDVPTVPASTGPRLTTPLTGARPGGSQPGGGSIRWPAARAGESVA